MRAFIAVPLDDALRPGLASVQEDLRVAGGAVSWVRPESLHLTLKFLGEIPDTTRLDFRPGPPFDLELAGIGEFGGRVVWAGCRGADGALRALAAKSEEAGERFGVSRERRPFIGHVTLGRIRSPRNLKRLRERMVPWKDRVFGPWPVRRVVLFRSERSPEGAVYTVVAEYPCA